MDRAGVEQSSPSRGFVPATFPPWAIGQEKMPPCREIVVILTTGGTNRTALKPLVGLRHIQPFRVSAVTFSRAPRVSSCPIADHLSGRLTVSLGCRLARRRLRAEGGQMVGVVPPSMTYSAPMIEEARSETRKATSSATSWGRFGR